MKDISEKDLANRIEGIFNSAVAVCTRINSFAYDVSFKDKTDIGAPINQVSFKRVYDCPALVELSEEIPVLQFSNAYMGRASNSDPSSGWGKRYKMKQDPFHRDKLGLDRASTSLFFKDRDYEREAPTYFALPDSARRAIKAQIDETTHPKDVNKAMAEMSHPGYSFTLLDKHLPPRQILQKKHEDFTQNTYDLIPDDEKFAHHWKTDEDVVIMFNNQAETVLHARPASNDKQNKVQIIDLIYNLD